MDNKTNRRNIKDHSFFLKVYNILCVVLGIKKYGAEYNAVPMEPRDLVREIGKQMTRPCLKHNNIWEQKEKLCLIVEVIEGIQESQTSELSFRMS